MSALVPNGQSASDPDLLVSVDDDGWPDSAHAVAPRRPGRTFRNFDACQTYAERPFEWPSHRHAQHQIVWPRYGSVDVVTDAGRWRLSPDRLAWIPGGVVHGVAVPEGTDVVTVYAAPSLRPLGERWSRECVLEASRLVGELLVLLTDRSISNVRRLRAQELLYDLLESADERLDALAVPRHPAARPVAEALLDRPECNDDLDTWAARLGVSGRTIARAFVAETGMPFARWRTLLRIDVASRLLEEQVVVSEVAERVGYETTTGFIKAFRAVRHTTPGRYADSLVRGA